jgi:hypothetical protein
MPAGIPTGIPAGIPAGSTPRARAVIQAELPDEATAELPSRRARPQERHSRLARFLGRWTQSGRFVSDSRAPARNQREEDMEVPRDPLGRNVLLVLVVASVTFLLTLVAVKARQHFADKPAPAATSKSLGR